MVHFAGCSISEHWTKFSVIGKKDHNWLVGFYGISTFEGYLMPNPFYVLFQTIQFSMNTQFNYQKHFYFKLFKFSQTVLIQQIQFSISIHFVYTQLKCQNCGILNNSSLVQLQFQCQKQFHFKQFSLAYVHSLNVSTV